MQEIIKTECIIMVINYSRALSLITGAYRLAVERMPCKRRYSSLVYVIKDYVLLFFCTRLIIVSTTGFTLSWMLCNCITWIRKTQGEKEDNKKSELILHQPRSLLNKGTDQGRSVTSYIKVSRNCGRTELSKWLKK